MKNSDLGEIDLATGPEQGVYLVAHSRVGDVTLERLDELVRATVHSVDEIFPIAMSMGQAPLCRRRLSK